MTKMMDAIESLRDEVVALKGEPTRKKDSAAAPTSPPKTK